MYVGFDPTADSLHLGNLIPVMALAHAQRNGHRPLVLVGGGTGLIGDPSGKTSERTLLTKEKADYNAAQIRTQLSRFFDLSSDENALMLNNADWLLPLGLLDFLRDIGKHFSVNEMMKRDSVRTRLEERDHGISYHRIQLHADAGLRLSPSVSAPRLHDSDGRQRSVGEHSFGQGTDPPHRWASAAKVLLSRC